MARAETMRPPGRTRGQYVQRACNHCRHRKTKCDGVRPVCGTCRSAEHECLWGAAPTPKSHTRNYVASLVSMKQLLEKRVEELVLENRNMKIKYGELSPTDSAAYFATRQQLTLPGHEIPADYGSPSGSSSSDSDRSYIKQEDVDDADITAIADPMHHLHLQDGNLHLLGPTSVLRLEHREPEKPVIGHDVGQTDLCTYVLYQQNSTVDWRRYLPAEVALTQQEHDAILDRFFKYFSSWHLRVNKQLFLRDMYRVLHYPPLHPPPKLSHYSPMLHNAILSVASAFADDPAVKCAEARQAFANKARDSLEAECDRPTLSAILALSILANYHTSRKSPTLGYMYFGISARISQALGLGVDCTPWVEQGLISHESMVDRNWIFWTTFCQDTTWSLYVGCDFSVSSMANIQNTPYLIESSTSEQETFHMTVTLLIIAREIMEVVNNNPRQGGRQEPNDLKIADIDCKLSKWQDELPENVAVTKANIANVEPHQLMLQMTYHWLIIVLHRPFYRRKQHRDEDSGFEPAHVKQCNKAAAEIMELARAWKTHHDIRFVPITFIQVVSAAGTVFILEALQATAGPRLANQRLESARSRTEDAIRFLSEVGETFASAAGIAQILRSLLDHQVEPRVARRGVGRPHHADQYLPSSFAPASASSSSVSPNSPSGPSFYGVPSLTQPPSGGAPLQPCFGSPGTSPASSPSDWTHVNFHMPPPAPPAEFNLPSFSGPEMPIFQPQFSFSTEYSAGGPHAYGAGSAGMLGGVSNWGDGGSAAAAGGGGAFGTVDFMGGAYPGAYVHPNAAMGMYGQPGRGIGQQLPDDFLVNTLTRM